MQVEFENGALGVIHASRFMTGYGNVLKLDVFGTKGAIEINHGSEWTEIRMCSGEDVHTQAWRKVAADGVPTIHARFIDAVRVGRQWRSVVPARRDAAGDSRSVLQQGRGAGHAGDVAGLTFRPEFRWRGGRPPAAPCHRS